MCISLLRGSLHYSGQGYHGSAVSKSMHIWSSWPNNMQVHLQNEIQGIAPHVQNKHLVDVWYVTFHIRSRTAFNLYSDTFTYSLPPSCRLKYWRSQKLTCSRSHNQIVLQLTQPELPALTCNFEGQEGCLMIIITTMTIIFLCKRKENLKPNNH